MSQIKNWIKSFRLRTLPLAFSTIVAGSVTAVVYNSFNWQIFILACLTTLFLQILSNLANDLGDAVSGADKFRSGPTRMVQSGQISRNEMKKMIYVFVILSLISGIILIKISFPVLFSFTGIIFLILGIAAIGAAINYTIGNNPYGYKGWGDFFVFIFFGLVGVEGTFYLHTKTISLLSFLPAIFVGLLSVGVLNINNIRDEKTDKAANKKSLIVLFGHHFGIIYHICLISIAIASITLFTYTINSNHQKWIYLITIPFFIIHLINVSHAKAAAQHDKELKNLAILTFVTVLIWGFGVIY